MAGPPVSVSGEFVSGGRTLLVVGASDHRRARSTALLTSAGHNVVDVATHAEALAFVDAYAPPLVVMDFEPHDAEGRAICARIKGTNPDTFILQISSQNVEVGAATGELDPAIDAYLVDPIDPQEMAVLVRSLLRLQKVEAELRDSEERLTLAQESAGLAILDWHVPTNRFVHSDNFLDVFDLDPPSETQPSTAATLRARIHPDDFEPLIAEVLGDRSGPHMFETEFRIVCRDGSVRWIASRGRVFAGAGGQPERVLSLNYDVTERKQAERTNAELASIVASSIDAIIGIDLSSCVTSWNAGATRLFGLAAETMLGRPWVDALADLSGEEHAGLGQLVDGGTHEFETRQTLQGGDVVDLWVTATPLRAPRGALIGASLIIRDMSQQKRREEHVQFLMRELTHRSKNLLAVIQAMARQSLTRDVTPEEFVRRFTDRLAGLAGSHDLLSRVNWRGASLMELIRSQLSHYMDLFGTRILMEGEDLLLKPEAAQNIGIALHELSTNAAKYGALSNDTGCVRIVWAMESRSEPMLVMNWCETDGPPVSVPTRKGFGHVVMERITGRALGGTSELRFEPSGVTWTLAVPASGLSERPATPR